MKRPKLSQLLTRSSGLMAARIAGGVAALSANIVIARNFGADALGVFALVMSVVSLASVVLPLGFQAVGTLFVSRYVEQDRSDRISGFARQGYSNIALLTGVAAAGLAAMIALDAPAAYRDHALTAGFVVAMAPALALINFNGSILNGYRRQFLALLPDLLIKPVLMLLALAALAYFHRSASTASLLVTACLALWASALIQAVIMSRQCQRKSPAVQDDRTQWRRAAFPWMLITILSDYFVELHLLLAGLLVAPTQVAILHICFRLRVLAGFGMRALHVLILPDLYASHERGDWGELRSNILRANGLMLGYSLAVCLAVLALGNHVLSMLGTEFEGGRTTLLIVCAAMIARAVFGPAPALMAVKGYHRAAISIPLAGTAVSVALGLALYPALGIEGIAIAYAFSYSLIALSQWWWIKRNTGIDCSIFAGLSSRDVRQDVVAPT